ncbi:MAG: hypothetical protein DMG26_13925, partial [Acidobacteria bacterium]
MAPELPQSVPEDEPRPLEWEGQAMRTSFSAITLAGCAMIAAQVVGAAESTKDDSWQNLKHVRHDRAYTFVDRERNCIAGETVAVTQHSIT